MSAQVVFFFVAGLAILIAGAELLVRGSSRLASSFGLSPLLIGLTVVSFGTSAPEVTVSLIAAAEGKADFAFGNVVGSNTFNILFILGLCGMIAPLTVARKLIKVDVPIMIGASILMMALAWNGSVGRMEGLLLLGLLAIYTSFSVVHAKRESAKVQEEYAREFAPKKAAPSGSRFVLAFMILAGLGLLVLGSHWLVDSAVTVARAFGVSELIIGLTILAAGTSLPEIATSVLATIRGERDIAVGNVIGSNLFNIFGVLGLSALTSPSGIATSEIAMRFDVPVMVAVAMAALPICFTGGRISRWEGTLFLGYYVAYTGFLTLDAAKHDALPYFSDIMMLFVVPLTVLALAASLWKALRRK